MNPDLAAQLRDELAGLAALSRLRRLPELAGQNRVSVTVAARPLVSFCSNDYLGLASHPALPAAATAAMAFSGFGAGASRLVSGDLPAHRSLEARLTAFLGSSSTLLFPSGYQANIAVVTALAGPQDLVVSDAANHASLIDGCRLSRATIRVYPHLDAAAARQHLQPGGPFRRRLLITESLFSMDGDFAPLAALAEVASEAGAALVVDEAHAIGALGPGGRGLCAAADVQPDVLVGTLGKSFGAAGGFVAGAPELRAILENRARTFLFTTAPPPAIAAAAEAAVDLVDSNEGATLRQRLRDRIQQLHHALAGSRFARREPGPPLSPIVPFVLGPDKEALAAADSLAEAGFFAQPIRPPTVPENTARLRITLSARHTADEVDRLAAHLRTL